jgi:DNA-binding CsgD family transcriptional regulator
MATRVGSDGTSLTIDFGTSQAVTVPVDFDATASAIFDDLVCGAAVVTVAGLIIVCNRIAARSMGLEPAQAAGKHLSELFPKGWVDEELSRLRRAALERRPLMHRTTIRGHAWRMVLRPLPKRGGEPITHLLVLGTPHDGLSSQLWDDPTLAVSPIADAPAASRLSRREKEVLALIGDGLSTNDIAAKLERSPKTVQAIRTMLGHKLGRKNRVQLAKYALQLGLTWPLPPEREAPGRAGVAAIAAQADLNQSPK